METAWVETAGMVAAGAEAAWVKATRMVTAWAERAGMKATGTEPAPTRMEAASAEMHPARTMLGGGRRKRC
jgi:hypothetical protein